LPRPPAQEALRRDKLISPAPHIVLMGAVRAFERVIDEVIALIMVLATVWFVLKGIAIPDWFATAFGLVIGFYFAKKGIEYAAGRRGG